MVPVQDGASTQGENLLLPPKEVSKMHYFLKTFSFFGSKLCFITFLICCMLKDFKDSENPEESEKRHKEKELKPLYKELLYTITHILGKTHTKEQYSAKQLQDYIKEAFSMTEDEHKTLSEKVQSMLAPIYSLMVTVKQAKGILGKDISGFSDPYCLLSILCEDKESRAGGSSNKPQKAVVRGSAKGLVLQTTIKKQTLNPIWDETFKLDKDEEVSLVQKFDEFRTNIHGLRRMIKDAKKLKGQDDFLGNVVLKLKDLHCTEDTWYNLEPRTETYPDRGQCHLQLKYIHKERDETLSAGRSPYVNYCGILQQFVQAHISKQQDSNPWKGELCGEGTALLEHYANQNNISPFLQDLAKWVAYSKLYQSLEVDSTVLFQQLTSIEYHWDQQELPYLQKQELGDSLHGFLQYGLCLVSKYRDIYPPTPKTTPRLQTLLRVLVQICKTRAFQKLNPAQFDLHVEVIDAVVNGTEEWFNIKKGLHQPMTKDPLESIGALSQLIGEVQEDIRLSKDVWNKVFVSAVQLDVFTVVYRKLDSLLADELQATLSQLENQMDQPLANGLFPVYLNLQAIHKDKAFLQKRGKLLQLTSFHEDFRDALPYWLNKAFSTTMERVEKAVHVDQLQPLQTGGVPIKHSSSAVDIAACLHPVAQLWEHLSWPDPEEAFMLMVKLTEVHTHTHTHTHLNAEDSSEGLMMMWNCMWCLCVVVNDLEHLHTVLTRLPQQLHWAGLRERTRHVIGDIQFQNTLPSQLQHTQSALNREIRSAVETLGKKLNKDIETHVRNMASRQRLPSRSTEDAVVPLMKYLEKELQYMNENLVQENFNSLLTPLWMNSVKILHQMFLQEDSNLVYVQRLLYALQCLEQCFHAEGNGLSLETLHTEEYKTLRANLTQNSLSCNQLIEKFFERKVWEQKVFNGEKYGAVTLITSYKRSENKLHVEVLNAINLIPLDSNGSSDPFVQLSLEPKHLFPQVEPRSTKIKNCDLNPLFEESFELYVHHFSSLLESKLLCKVLTVQFNMTSCYLMPLVFVGENTLKLLEARKGEREAQAFVKLRRQREKKSQET
uniref:Protein unc-13 homolog D-like n=1 Tax=Sinocyclocheilus grahami TaxID=75366 RepID=A0A672JWK3_SINGR